MRSATLPAGLPSRFAVAVSKKVAKTAVLRNKMKRVVYTAIEMLNKDILTSELGVMTIFGVKKDISKTSFEEIVEELRGLLLKKGQK